MGLKRDTRVQIVIVENGKYILLKHHFKDEDRYFWGVPGGGQEEGETEEEAAIREAEEETGLKIELLPVRFEENSRYSKLYKRMLLFMGYPISGEAHTGYDPEPDAILHFELCDIMWQDFYDDEGIDDIVEGQINLCRDYLKTNPFTKRAAALIYKIENGEIYFLFVSSSNGESFVMPQGHHETGEEMEETAVREAKEESGAEVQIQKKLGFFFHKHKEEYCYTEVFLAELIKQGQAMEVRKVKWFSYDEAMNLNLHRETRRFIEEVYSE